MMGENTAEVKIKYVLTEGIKIPKDALKYIIFQRCDLQKFGKKINYSKFAHYIYRLYDRYVWLQRLYFWYSSNLEIIFRSSKIMKGYQTMLQDDFDNICEHLPVNAESILDIGCGVAGLDAILYRFYIHQGSQLDMFLVDKTGMSEKIHYFYSEKAAIYNSLDVAKHLLEENGVESSHIVTIDADQFNSKEMASVDLVISTLAWGFHFPVSVYISKVYELMKEGGVLILDVREGSDGLNTLKEYFENYEIIKKGHRFLRIKLVKNGNK